MRDIWPEIPYLIISDHTCPVCSNPLYQYTSEYYINSSGVTMYKYRCRYCEKDMPLFKDEDLDSDS